ncbi:MAG: PAS-domain containing protein [Alphaproteobacteria bacterium]|nr:PAS-domain containing protein [Alphaproteobacteria bacterium]
MRLDLSSSPRAPSLRAPVVLAWAFALIAATLFFGLGYGLTTTRTQAAQDELVESIQRENGAVVAIVSRLLGQALGAYQAESLAEPDAWSADYDLTDDLRALIRVSAVAMSRATAIAKVKLYNREGRVIFSTTPDEVGSGASSYDGIEQAISGVRYGVLVHRPLFGAIGGELRDADIVASFFPFGLVENRIDAVIEVYTDVTAVFAAQRENLRRETWLVAGTLASAYLFLLLIVAWGGRLLRASERAVADRSAKLDEVSRFLRDGIESMSEGIAFWDESHRLLMFNGRYLELLPHLKPFVRLGMTLREINERAIRALHPELAEGEYTRLVDARLSIRRELGKSWPVEFPSGRIVEIVDHAMAKGGYVSIFRDITDASRAAERLAASERRFRDAIESIGDGFVMFDRDDRVVLWNSRYLRILPFLDGALHVGMTARGLLEVLAESFEYGIPPDARAAWVDANVDRRSPDRRVYRRELTDGRLLEGTIHETAQGGFALVLRDVTAMRDAQLAVANSEQRFRDFASATADWFWELDEELRFTFLSESNYEITGTAAEDFYATSPLDFRPEGVTDHDWDAHLRILRAHEPFKDFRFRAVGANGVVRTVATSGRPFFDEHGRFKGYRGIGTDISLVVETQRRAEASEALLRDGIEGMANGLIMFDGDQRVALWNSRYVELFPYLRGVMRVGMSARELLTLHAESAAYGLPPEERIQWVESRMAYDPTRQNDILQTLADGRTLRIRGTGSRNKGEIYVVLDVTAEVIAKKRLEQTLQELRESQEEVRRLALVAQHTDNAVIITDATGRVEWANAAFTRISGYGLDEIVGRRPGALLQGPDTDAETVASIREAVARGEGFRVELLNYGKSGRPYWIEIDCSPVRDEIGQVARFIAVEADITERKQQERRLAEALEREREVSLQQRRFVSVAAHEFRTPLTIIDGAAQRLLRYADQISPDDLRDRARKIRGAVQRMSQLVDTTLNTARLDEGRIELNLGTVDVVALITGICRRGDGFAPDFKFTIATSAASLPVQADPRLLDQVFTNLLSNAVKYSAESRRVDIQVRGDAQSVEVAIRDYGIGVPAHEVDQLFTRFYRASTARGLPGTGIGLSLVRDLVRLHGGDVAVRSEVGQGSTFTVRLPVSVEHARVATLAPAAE